MKKGIICTAAAVFLLCTTQIYAQADSNPEAVTAEAAISEAAATEAAISDAAAADNAITEAGTTDTATTDATAADAVSSASVKDFYGDYAISGDELMNAINAYSGFYAVSTVNEDGTPQLGFFVYSMLKDGDTYYVMLGLEKNQTRVNLERTGKAVAMYAVRPGDDAQPQYATSGARLELEPVTDKDLIEKLNTAGYDTSMFCKVTEIKSLG